jgi:hypothetical protein
MISGTSCPACGQQLPGHDQRRTGRKPRYCSNACKAKAYRDRQHSGEHASAAGSPLPSCAADRYARTIEIRQQISDLTTAMAETASGQQALFASPSTPRRIRPAETAEALHRLVTELAALAVVAPAQTRRTRARPGAETPPLFGEPETDERQQPAADRAAATESFREFQYPTSPLGTTAGVLDRPGWPRSSATCAHGRAG